MINGSATGFFKSFLGIHQGDPLSSALFVIASEFLRKELEELFNNGTRMHYVAKVGDISHLAFADDMIIFIQLSKHALCRTEQFLQFYQKESGQKINANKSFFICFNKVSTSKVKMVASIFGFKQQHLPFTICDWPNPPMFQVSDFIWNRNGININYLNGCMMPSDIVSLVVRTPFTLIDKDAIICSLLSLASFSISDTWNAVRSKKNISTVSKVIWSELIPLKILFFGWRLLSNFLHLDDTLQAQGLNLS